MATPLRSIKYQDSTASLTASSGTTFRRCVGVARHFVSRRGLEVAALQASPFLGIALGGFSYAQSGLVQAGLLLLGSLALTAHIFVLNDWAGRSSDIRDPRRSPLVYAQQGISGRQVIGVAIALLLIAALALAAVSPLAIVLGAAITVLSLLYSFSSIFGKSSPIVGSLNHHIGGSLHFLLGYTCYHVLDARGISISLFFGLVFAAGHLNQEVRDYEGDRLNGIRTSAVVFGCRRVFIASVCTFTAAYALLVFLSAIDVLPRLLLLGVVAWLLQVFWSQRALQRGPGFETAVWMQRRYRVIFGVIGLAMLVR